MYDAVFDFFAGKAKLNSLNCTCITLIPKVTNASLVREFKPISCCLVVYKIIAKVLAAQNVLPRIVSQAQTCFIPSRVIVDNVMLASEIIKGYNFAQISALDVRSNLT